MVYDVAHITEVCIVETLFKREGADDSAAKTLSDVSTKLDFKRTTVSRTVQMCLYYSELHQQSEIDHIFLINYISEWSTSFKC